MRVNLHQVLVQEKVQSHQTLTVVERKNTSIEEKQARERIQIHLNQKMTGGKQNMARKQEKRLAMRS